jgi:dihydroorotase
MHTKKTIHIKNATLINEGSITKGVDVLIDKNGYIALVSTSSISTHAEIVIDAEGKYLIPGVIDAHVHFREPGLTHKGDIDSESRAAVAGGTTSFMDMPNTNPQVLTQQLLEDKYDLASKKSLANYSFFMGVSNSNVDEVLKTDATRVCGAKIFMCHSTGNMKANSNDMLEAMFSRCKFLIATHCEDEEIINENMEKAKQQYGDQVPWDIHADIRSESACVKSTKLAMSLAQQYNTRLHVVHLTTAGEIDLFKQFNNIPLNQKRITCETTPHHLWFDRNDYAKLGALIKCNPSIKDTKHKNALLDAIISNDIDMIATDHAPHTLLEKQDPSYWTCPSGIPTIQYSLNILLELYQQGKIELIKIVEKMCHSPAICFQISKRGFIREGYWADLVLFELQSDTNPDAVTLVNRDYTIYSKCGWSPFDGYQFKSRITHTIVSGHVAFANGVIDDTVKGQRILFDR